jgi:hypothetical protein
MEGEGEGGGRERGPEGERDKGFAMRPFIRPPRHMDTRHARRGEKLMLVVSVGTRCVWGG